MKQTTTLADLDEWAGALSAASRANLLDAADAITVMTALASGLPSETALLVLADARDWRQDCQSAHGLLPVGDLGWLVEVLTPGHEVRVRAELWTDLCVLADEQHRLATDPDAVDAYLDPQVPCWDRDGFRREQIDRANDELERVAGLLAGGGTND